MKPLIVLKPIPRFILSFRRKPESISIILLLVILLLAAFVRLYHIADYMTFLGDEGRDVLIVKRMLVDHKFTFLGPTASVGGFYLGPIYYYMMVIPLLIFNFNPVGPAVMVAIFGVMTVWLLYLTAKEFASILVALLISFLYSISPTIINYSHSSWNPNIMPFFSLLIIFSLIKAIKSGNLKYVFASGLSFGVAIQSHYLGFIMGPVFILSLIVLLDRKKIIKGSLLFILGSIITFSPFLFFEIRHHFPNTITIIHFLGQKRITDGFAGANPFLRFDYYAQRLYEIVFFLKNIPALKYVLYLFSILTLVFSFLRTRSKVIAVLVIWFSVGLVGLAAYAGQVYDYYFEFLFPAPFLILAVLLNELFRNKIIGLIASVIITVILGFFMLTNNPLLHEPNKMLLQAQKVAQLVVNEANNQPYNFALMTTSSSDHVYRYFMEIWNKKPSALEEKVEDQLIVVCELKNCQPLGYPLWEIAGFGRAEIASVEEGPVGIKIFRLIHWQEN